MYPIEKIRIAFRVIETKQNQHTIDFQIDENHVTMKEVALLLYKMKQVEQELLDRIWDKGGEGYEIETQD